MSGNEEKDVRARYESVCAELNMDEQTIEKAWSSYTEINNDYVLEVSCGPRGCNEGPVEAGFGPREREDSPALCWSLWQKVLMCCYAMSRKGWVPACVANVRTCTIQQYTLPKGFANV